MLERSMEIARSAVNQNGELYKKAPPNQAAHSSLWVLINLSTSFPY
jgi:hypothetical protein